MKSDYIYILAFNAAIDLMLEGKIDILALV